jgi:hypothetical protein
MISWNFRGASHLRLRKGKKGAKEADVNHAAELYSNFDAHGWYGNANMRLYIAALFIIGTLARLVDW